MNLPPRMRARVRGAKTYYMYDLGGKPRKEVSLGTEFVAAVRKWAELEREQMPSVAIPTFDFAATAYTKKIVPTKALATQRDNLRELPNLREFFADAPLDEIQPVHVRQYLSWRVEKTRAWLISKGRDAPADAGSIRANREIALFSHVFNFARQEGLTAATNPCSGVTKFREVGRDIYIEDETFALLYKHSAEPLRDAIDLAYLTAQRPADTLAYDERDLRDGTLSLRQGKTGTKLRISVVGELAEVIERIRARKRSYTIVSMSLIVDESGQAVSQRRLRSYFDKARQLAGIPKSDYQFRDIRAKAATDKTDSAGDIRQAQRQLGHKSITMTEHYVRNRRGSKVEPTR